MPSKIFGAVPPLHPGARVALVAPAGVLRREEDIARALDNIRSLGWIPVVGSNIRSQLGYLAGSDAERLHDINSALASDDVDAVWCIRGGYGSMRLLASLDYEATLRSVARLAVPTIADWCAVDILGADRHLPRLAGARVDPLERDHLSARSAASGISAKSTSTAATGNASFNP